MSDNAKPASVCTVEGIVRFLIYAMAVVCVIWIAINHHTINEMKKQQLRLSIELLEIQLGIESNKQLKRNKAGGKVSGGDTSSSAAGLGGNLTTAGGMSPITRIAMQAHEAFMKRLSWRLLRWHIEKKGQSLEEIAAMVDDSEPIHWVAELRDKGYDRIEWNDERERFVFK